MLSLNQSLEKIYILYRFIYCIDLMKYKSYKIRHYLLLSSSNIESRIHGEFIILLYNYFYDIIQAF